MSIIAAYYYNEGKRVREIALDEHVKLGESRSGFCWIALSEPTPEELLAIQRTYMILPSTGGHRSKRSFGPRRPPG